jgi:hexosaminidase
MKFPLYAIVLYLSVVLSNTVDAQVILPVLPDTAFPTYYRQRTEHFNSLPKKQHQVVFVGNSITDGAEWGELFEDPNIQNRGISGDVTSGVISRLPELMKTSPKKMFLLIGVNDLSRGTGVDSIFKNIGLIARYVKQECPGTALYVQSLLPVNDSFKAFPSHTNKATSIQQLNLRLNRNAMAYGYTYLDFYQYFTNEQGKLDPKFTNDGLHLRGEGYALWKHLLYPSVYNISQFASLIPEPVKTVRNQGVFPVYKVNTIFYNTDSLRAEARVLQKTLAGLGIVSIIKQGTAKGEDSSVQLFQDMNINLTSGYESYQLKVDQKRILIAGRGTAGIFYGIQTLKQLCRDGYFIDNLEISDAPAFKWRGYMVDVGRNFQSLALLKQQIDQMASYKLNVFHLHLTEDIAWRIAIKQYPKLTSPDNMLRNKGLFYTEAELKDLIQYCRDRHILLVPEIDMPGHSSAFKRAMGVDMQSDSGLVIVKNILKEFLQTYDIPVIHIGADEVKINNKKFVPEIIAFLDSMKVKIVGWEPGGNYDKSVIRQLWMDDAGLTSGKSKIQYIDSRHLYINHMDPLESVVTIFNRQLCDVNTGNAEALGATLCLWPDRAVAKEDDVIRMNGVYPAMLAFSERTWRGGGNPGWVATMDLAGSKGFDAFRTFEDRLMEHKKLYFSTLSFPYQQQASMDWKLYGPYKNGGNLSQSFAPEDVEFNPDHKKPALNAKGGTIILRHWWAPKIQAVLSKPAENTTWYAFTKIWSEQDTVKDFWIGFNNPSRSQATDSPMQNTWDNHQSAVWVNGIMVPAPEWLHAGQKGNLEIPLVDEGYEYRRPTLLRLKKGWNIIRIKSPIGMFAAKDWNNPEKWMFTFVECEGAGQ